MMGGKMGGNDSRGLFYREIRLSPRWNNSPDDRRRLSASSISGVVAFEIVALRAVTNAVFSHLHLIGYRGSYT